MKIYNSLKYMLLLFGIANFVPTTVYSDNSLHSSEVQSAFHCVQKSSAGNVFENVEGTIAWSVGNEVSGTISEEVVSAVSAASVSSGDKLTIGTATYFGSTMVKYTPMIKNAGNVEGVMIEYCVKTAVGISFKPLSFSYDCVKVGTDNATYSWSYTVGGEESKITTVDAATTLRNSGSNSATADLNHKIDITAEASDVFTLRFYISQTANNKDICIGNIIITGIFNGTVIDVPKYTLSATSNITEAGSVTIYPQSQQYDEGTEVTLTAIENFGYDFVNWTDDKGNEVSAEYKFTWKATSDAILTANFKKVNTYTLNLTVENPAKDYMVQWEPAPTVIDGDKMYEEGTKVVLTASNNRILDFAGWSNDETATEIVLDMVQDVSLTARYETKVDFIAGWDFILRGASGRVADFAAADNDADQLVLRDAEGNTASWLDKSQEAANGYEGKPAAVNWVKSAPIGTYYYQIKVNAEAFTDIKVYAEMLYNYNAYQKQDVEYSIDNEHWTLLGSIQMKSPKTWTSGEFTLPAEANNQKELYIRWKADTSSTVDGATSDNDGTSITDIYVTGTMKLVDDGKAPVLVATTPREAATNASANGKIVLTFDEKVKVAEGTVATLNDQSLIPVISGKSIMFEYKSLEYSTAYTFTLPANSISDLTDNVVAEAITINFSTKTKPAVTKSLYDFIVPDDGNFKEALTAASKRTDMDRRYRIFVKQGNHIIPADNSKVVTGADGKEYADPRTYFNTPNVSIIGEDRASTSIANYMTTESYEGQYGATHPLEGIRSSGLLYLQSGATNTYFEDITLRSNTPDARGRNVVLVDGGNKTICKNVCLWAYQDTYVSDSEKSLYYFEGGVIRGRTDFICGSGDVFFNAVDIQMCEEGGYIVAPRSNVKYGYVFKNCTIKGEKSSVNGKYYLGRPWTEAAETYFIDCVMEAIPKAEGWTNMSDGGCTRFAEYNSISSTGTAVDLSGRAKELGKVTLNPNNPVLTAVEAAEIGNMSNMFGDWDPTNYTEQASAPTNVKMDGSVITWDNSNYVLLWAICKNGKVIDFTTQPTYTVNDATATYSIRAANEMGGLGVATVATNATDMPAFTIEGKAVSITIYNAQGMEIPAMQQGINIVCTTFDDGRVKSQKVMVQ